MATVRFFLGAIESIIGPVFVIVTSNWWTRQEQALRTAFWLSGTPVCLKSILEDDFILTTILTLFRLVTF